MRYDSDSLFMRIALDYAWNFQTLTLPNPCVGALVLCDNTIIACKHTKRLAPHMLKCLRVRKHFYIKLRMMK